MIFYPAVDIRGGRAVRLRQGRFDSETVYADDPLDAARSFVAAGARRLHVVDLDGAREGAPANLHHLRRIAREAGVTVQFGGGLRSLDSIGAALEAGAERVLVGTAAHAGPQLLADALERWGERVAVAVDTRAGRVSLAGWTQQTQTSAESLIARLRDQGVRRFVYTNADRDGMLDGADPAEARAISAAVGDASFMMSGGIGSLEDLATLRDLALANLEGVVSGKALYEGRFTVRQAHEALGEAHRGPDPRARHRNQGPDAPRR